MLVFSRNLQYGACIFSTPWQTVILLSLDRLLKFNSLRIQCPEISESSFNVVFSPTSLALKRILPLQHTNAFLLYYDVHLH